MGKYMKKVGHADANLLAEEPYYAHTNKKGCSGLLVFLCVYRIGSKW